MTQPKHATKIRLIASCAALALCLDMAVTPQARAQQEQRLALQSIDMDNAESHQTQPTKEHPQSAPTKNTANNTAENTEQTEAHKAKPKKVGMLHITMPRPGETAPHDQGKIRIITGKVFDDLNTQSKPRPALSHNAQQAKRPKIARANEKSCPFDIGDADTLESKHLAGALRYYLEDQGQNPAIIDALTQASRKTGVDFGLLVLAAKIESNLGQNTISKNSSARGPFQFIESTWLILMKENGDRIGHKAEADSIQYNEKTGNISIKNNGRITRESILSLRSDPKTAAMIKAYQITDEEKALGGLKKGKIQATDYYIAHMLGLTLAKEFYDLRNDESRQFLSDSNTPLMREAAQLNPYFFYASTGSKTKTRPRWPLTAEEAYSRFHKRVTHAVQNLQTIEDDYGLGEDFTSLFRAPCGK